MQVTQTDDMSIAQFMAKPYPVYVGTFLNTSPVSAILYQESVSTLLETPSVWTNKMSGYSLVRGTAVFRVVINANPFQSGRLLLFFMPGTLQDNLLARNMHTVNLSNKTQLPNVELDIQDGTAELRVPYVTPTTYYNRITNNIDWGRFYIAVLGDLRTGAAGTPSADYTVYLSFEDFEVAAPMVPESGLAVKAQKAMVSERQNAAKSRSIPASILQLVTNRVPLIGTAISTVASGARAVSSIAASLGYSRPLDTTAPVPMLPNYGHMIQNFDSVNTAENMTVASSASLAPLPGFAGSAIDEMSMKYLLPIPAYVGDVVWSASQLPDTNLYSQAVNPYDLAYQDTEAFGSNAVTFKCGPPVCALAKYFMYWRGSFKFTLKFVKTQYHTGRIQVMFQPRDNTGSIVDNLYALNEIIDLRTATEVTLELPYMRETPFLTTKYHGSVAFMDTSAGRLTIRVVNQLVAPDTASQDVRILFYVAAGDDFEFAGPMPFDNPVWRFESGLESLVDKPIGTAAHSDPNQVYNAVCIGDPITSLKQLLLQPKKLFINGTYGPSCTLWPFALCATKYGTIPVSNGIGGDYIAEFSAGYYLARGGVRISNFATTEGVSGNGRAALVVMAAGSPVYTNAAPIVQTSNISTNWAAVKCGAIMTFRPQASGSLDVVVPHYSRVATRENWYYPETTAPVVRDSDDTPQLGLESTFSTTTSGTLSYTRAAADDFQLGYFIGFPPWVISVAPV